MASEQHLPERHWWLHATEQHEGRNSSTHHKKCECRGIKTEEQRKKDKRHAWHTTGKIILEKMHVLVNTLQPYLRFDIDFYWWTSQNRMNTWYSSLFFISKTYSWLYVYFSGPILCKVHNLKSYHASGINKWILIFWNCSVKKVMKKIARSGQVGFYVLKSCINKIGRAKNNRFSQV